MKRIKLFSLAAIFCAATFVGYNAYQQSTMTEEERLMQANIEALSSDDETGGSSSSWTCWSSQKDGGGYWRCGNPCEWIDGYSGSGPKSECAAN